jgi:hypothetical protein
MAGLQVLSAALLGIRGFGMRSCVFEREFPHVAIDHSLKRQNQSSMSLGVEDSSF